MIRHLGTLTDLPFKDDNNDPTRYSFGKYYMPLVKIKNFEGLINNKPFFDLPLKSTEEAYERLVEMSRNGDHITGIY